MGKRQIITLAIILGATIAAVSALFHTASLLHEKREKALRKQCAAQLVSLGFALRMYANVYDGHFPPYNGARGLELLRQEGFCESTLAYRCPSTYGGANGYNGPLNEFNVSYAYFGGHTEDDPPDTILMCDKDGNHAGFANVLFLDGSVEGFWKSKHMRFSKSKNAYVKSDKDIPCQIPENKSPK